MLLECACAVAAEYAEAVRIVNQQRCAMFRAGLCEICKWCRIAVHAEHRVGGDQSAVFWAVVEHSLERSGVFVRIAFEACTGQHGSVKQ